LREKAAYFCSKDFGPATPCPESQVLAANFNKQAFGWSTSLLVSTATTAPCHPQDLVLSVVSKQERGRIGNTSEGREQEEEEQQQEEQREEEQEGEECLEGIVEGQAKGWTGERCA
jgi:hypothetical protein